MTQNEILICHFTFFGGITSYEAVKYYRIMSLSKRIHELCQSGYDIVAVGERCKDETTGKNKIFYRYMFRSDLMDYLMKNERRQRHG